MAIRNLFETSRLARHAAWGFARGFARGVVGGWRSPQSKQALVEALEQRQMMSSGPAADVIVSPTALMASPMTGVPVVITELTGRYDLDQNPGVEIDMVSFRIVGPGEATITPVLDGEGGPIVAYDVSIKGSTSQTSFLVQDFEGVAKLRTVFVAGSLQVFNAPQSDLVSSLTVMGGLGQLCVDDIYRDTALLDESLEQPLVLIGTDPGIAATNATLGEVQSLEYRALGPVRTFLANRISGVRDEEGHASVMIDAQSLFRVRSLDGIIGSDISAADDIGYINSTKNLESTRIEAGGSVTQVLASRMQYSQVYAGMTFLTGQLPTSVADFENKEASIGSVHLWDSSLDGSPGTLDVSFFSSVIAAWKVGVVQLQDVSPTAGTPYGIAGNSIASLSYLKPEQAYYGSEEVVLVPVMVSTLTRPDDPRLETGVDGYELQIYTTDFTPPTYKETEVLKSVNGELDVELTVANTKVSINGSPFTFNADTYNGGFPGPTLRVKPGDVLRVTIHNELDTSTNLHVHGLHVSPLGNSDNVFTNILPGTTSEYVYQIPADHPEGLFWYHPHVHHQVDEQVVMGLSGLLIVERDEGAIPELAGMEQKYMSIRNVPLNAIGEIDRNVPAALQTLMVNNQVNPILSIAPGETQVWHIGNIGNEGWYDLMLDGQPLRVVALDGNPMTEIMTVDHIQLAPGQRVAILVTGTEKGTFELKTAGINQGFDNWPAATLATLKVQGTPRTPVPLPTQLHPHNSYYEDLRNLGTNQTVSQNFGIAFGPDGVSFTFNGKAYDENRVDVTVMLNSVDEWVLTNSTTEWHPFHMHVNAFQVTEIDGVPVDYGTLRDVVELPPMHEDGTPSTVKFRIRYTDFVGLTVFHCHILIHEDLGMMANIEIVQPGYPGSGGSHEGHEDMDMVASSVEEIQEADGVKLTVIE